MDAEFTEVEQSDNVPQIADDTLVAVADQAEKRIEAVMKIKKIALRVTGIRDWTDQNGNPYLQVSGSEKVGRLFGISWRIGEPELTKEDGGHFSYTYKGEFSLGSQTIEAIGTRSSKDGFFKKYSYENNERKELPPSEIDKGDVKKAAYTNCVGNGVTRLLGIRNLTWSEVTEITGFSQSDVSGVQYKKKGAKTIQESSGKDLLTDGQRRRLWAITKSNNISDEEAGTFVDWLIAQEGVDTIEVDGKKKFTKQAIMKLFKDDDKLYKEKYNQWADEFLS